MSRKKTGFPTKEHGRIVYQIPMKPYHSVCAIVLLGCSGASQKNSVPTPGPVVTVATDSLAGTTTVGGKDGDEATTPLKGDLRAPFGGSNFGFVEASSANGRFVFLRRFAGQGMPAFGHHGEPMGDWPDLVGFDLLAGKEHPLEEIIDVEPNRRFFLLLDKSSVFLLDAEKGKWTTLDADMESDGNRCLSPRQATFSGEGNRVAWIKKGSQILAVQNLDNSENWSISGQGRVWRGWADDDGRGAVLAEVPTGSSDWPSQQTSCACRWCGRFAMSYGFYGWHGPAFAVQHVAEDGSRKDGDAPKTKRVWHGDTTSRCTLKAASEKDGLERGPWNWRCL